MSRHCFGLLSLISFVLYNLLSFFFRLFVAVSIDEKLLFNFERFIFRLEIEAIGDDMQTHAGLVLKS
jgi:hypothetical protein